MFQGALKRCNEFSGIGRHFKTFQEASERFSRVRFQWFQESFKGVSIEISRRFRVFLVDLVEFRKVLILLYFLFMCILT